MSKSIKLKALQLGVCYYPEHWPESLWEDDFRRMRELHMSVIRVAEFAWSIFDRRKTCSDLISLIGCWIWRTSTICRSSWERLQQHRLLGLRTLSKSA